MTGQPVTYSPPTTVVKKFYSNFHLLDPLELIYRVWQWLVHLGLGLCRENNLFHVTWGAIYHKRFRIKANGRFSTICQTIVILSISLSAVCNWIKIYRWPYALYHLSLSLVILLTVFGLVVHQSNSNIYSNSFHGILQIKCTYSNSTMFVLCTCRDWPKGMRAEWLGHFSQNFKAKIIAAQAFWELFRLISIYLYHVAVLGWLGIQLHLGHFQSWWNGRTKYIHVRTMLEKTSVPKKQD